MLTGSQWWPITVCERCARLASVFESVLRQARTVCHTPLRLPPPKHLHHRPPPPPPPPPWAPIATHMPGFSWSSRSGNTGRRARTARSPRSRRLLAGSGSHRLCARSSSAFTVRVVPTRFTPATQPPQRNPPAPLANPRASSATAKKFACRTTMSSQWHQQGRSHWRLCTPVHPRAPPAPPLVARGSSNWASSC